MLRWAHVPCDDATDPIGNPAAPEHSEIYVTNDTETDRKHAKAHPTKAFFVRMLTRDISLDDCILDLIDNSVDAAWSSVNATPTTLKTGHALRDFKIDLNILETEFSIVDNCGGISLDHAADYAFTFGRDESDGTDHFTVGVYGIGMKRAVFKLGNRISIRSTHAGNEPFKVPIDVKEWLADKADVWDFDIEEDDQLSEPGVAVHVSELKEETAAEFSDPTFQNRLRKIVARDYMFPIMQGLNICINGKAVKGWEIKYKSGSGFQPMRQLYHEGEVSVEIFAGMVAAPPSTSEPPNNNQDQRSGWYVLCNGRVVLAADRTDLTVWGKDRFPAWHSQYQGFVGVVLFSSRNPVLLPMTTTKNSVDTASALYRRAVAKMREPTRAWVDYTNARKPSRDTARAKELATKPVPIERVTKRKSVKLPTNMTGKKDANILYTVPVDRVKALARAFGKVTMSYKNVGQQSFDYSYDQLVEEENQ
ncbi:MAG: ATP-binding protein [Acidimicrobiaceae bacterium]|nr:ATP-binding protein [Acidimicrobiaceae bacterium]MYD07897.1 ATP-binding protein [Acidimicrobiaceae bacterium]MYI59392.1 ATP-binding protein [Acidimicrobiaceae bacterium]